jgi:hypothetical protein
MVILEVKLASALHTMATYASNTQVLVLLMIWSMIYLLPHSLLHLGRSTITLIGNPQCLDPMVLAGNGMKIRVSG